MGKLQVLTRSTIEVENHATSAERLQFYLEAPRELDIARPPAASVPDDWPSRDALQARRLCARYRPELPLTLHGISFELSAGSKVGIVGRTGSGKTTLLQCLLRLLEPCEGSVRLDGVDLQSVSLSTLRRRIAVIPQDPYLWQGDVRQNIDPLGICGSEEVNAVLTRARLAPKLRSLLKVADGDDSVPLHSVRVDDGGSNFSVGEKQLLCFARSMLRTTPRLVILDEATANIDSATDRVLQELVREAFAQATVLIVAHRLQTVSDCDRRSPAGHGRWTSAGQRLAQRADAAR